MRVMRWSIAVAALALALTSTAYAQETPCTPGTTVGTVEGLVCGVTADNGVTTYLGIRYAAAPIGNQRWAPPQPVTPWTSTFQATQDGTPCPQPATPTANEDCLKVNLQIPDHEEGERLPVMVEIHGGGFLGGNPRAGDNLVTNGSGKVIYVAMRYRLGILGFMAHRGLGPNSGNYGLQDQQATLRWVQRNIARFGGNPRNVTIFGQSAGGASVCAHAVSPTAAGLFQRGISESGFYNQSHGAQEVWEAADCKSRLPSQSEAEQAGASFAEEVGCGDAADEASCLRGVPTQTLIQNAGQTLNPAGGGTIAPTVNGTTLPMSPAKAFATGQINDVGMMIGADRDEINGGPLAESVTPTTPEGYREVVRRRYGRLASTVFALYPIERFPPPSAFLAYRTVVADSDSVCPALTSFRRLSKHTKVYAWEGDNPDAPRTDTTLPLGAFHDTEARFTFPRGDVWTANQQVFGAQVTSQWTGYARTGSPMVDFTPAWTPFDADNRLVMSLMPAGDSAQTPASTIAMQHHCGFWNAVSPPPR